MNKFKGFTDSETFTQLPDTFFHRVLKEIDDASELKVTLYLMWRVEHMEGPFRALNRMDFSVRDLGLAAEDITNGLEKAVKRGSLLKVQKETAVYFLLNSPRGRAGLQAIDSGQWNPITGAVSAPPVERPNIFKLYEENIGVLTPLIADALKDAEETYSEEWVADAIKIATINGVRKLPYLEAILKDWKENGRAEKQDTRNDKKSNEQSLDRKIEQLRKRAQK